jgi:hypothetical protein
MINLIGENYDGEISFDISDVETKDKAIEFVIKAEYKDQTVGARVKVPFEKKRSLFKSYTMIDPSRPLEFSSIGDESDRLIVALNEILCPDFPSSKKFSEQPAVVDFFIVNTSIYDPLTDKVYLRIFYDDDSGAEQEVERSEKVRLEMNFSFNIERKKAALIESEKGYSADLVTILMN